MTLISWLGDIPLYISTTTFYPLFSFLAYLWYTRVKVLVNRAALKFGVPLSCRFLCFRIYKSLRESAGCCVAQFGGCFRKHHTLFQSSCWPFTSCHQRNKASFSPWPVLHFWFLHFFRKSFLTDAKWDFYVVLICIARLFCWPKRMYAFFPEFIQEKMHTPFLANCIIVEVLPLFLCFIGQSNLPLENCFLQFCLAFTFSSLPYLNIFLNDSFHL